MPVEIELPDGTIAEFPDGMSNTMIEQALASHYKRDEANVPVAQPAESPEEGSIVTDALSGLGRAGKSFSKELVRGAASRGVGIMQLAADGIEAAGVNSEGLKQFQESAQNVATKLRKGGEGTGVSGAIAETLGDPATYLLGGAAKGKSLAGLIPIGGAGGVALGSTAPVEHGQSRTGNMIASGVIGAVTLPASVVAGDVTKKIATHLFNKATGKAPAIASAEHLDALARPFYDEVDKAQGAIKPAKAAQAISSIYKIVKPRSQAQANAIKDDVAFRMYADHFYPLLQNPLTLRDVDYLDGRLQTVISQNLKDKPAVAQLQRMRKVLTDLATKTEASDFVGGSEGFRAWKEGDRIFAAARAMKSLENVLEHAQSTQQPATTITTHIRNILKNPRTSNAFTKQEKEYLRQALDLGDIEDVVRTGGSRLNQIAATVQKGIAEGALVGGASRVVREVGIKAKENAVRKAQQAITSRVLGTPLPPLQKGASGAAASFGAASATGAGNEITNPVDVPPSRRLELDIPRPPEAEIRGDAGSDNLSSFTQQNEGLRLSAYRDTAGNPTIGYGFNFNSGIAPKVWKRAGVQTNYHKARRGEQAITPQEAQALYLTSYQVASDDARSYYSRFDSLNQPQQIALADLAYHHGLPSLKKSFPGLPRALATKDYARVAAIIRKSDYAQKFPGRARENLKLLLQGV